MKYYLNGKITLPQSDEGCTIGRSTKTLFYIRKEKSGMTKEFNRHHLIPSSRGGLTNKYNINTVPISEHTRWHTRCGNDTPVEAICRVLLRNEKIRTDNFRADLMAVLDNYINNYYNKKAYDGVIKSEVQNVLNLERN